MKKMAKPKKKTAKQKLIDLLKGYNDGIFRYQYNKTNTDALLQKRYVTELKLNKLIGKRPPIQFEVLSKTEISTRGLRDVYVAFIPKGWAQHQVVKDDVVDKIQYYLVSPDGKTKKLCKWGKYRIPEDVYKLDTESPEPIKIEPPKPEPKEPETPETPPEEPEETEEEKK